MFFSVGTPAFRYDSVFIVGHSPECMAKADSTAITNVPFILDIPANKIVNYLDNIPNTIVCFAMFGNASNTTM